MFLQIHLRSLSLLQFIFKWCSINVGFASLASLNLPHPGAFALIIIIDATWRAQLIFCFCLLLIFFCSHCRARRAIILIRSSRESVQILYRVQRALILPLILTSFSMPATEVALIVAPSRSSLLSRRRGRVLNSLSRCRGRAIPLSPRR